MSPDALFNIIGESTTVSLDTDDDVTNNFGSDGPGTITFANITSGVTDSGLLHDGQPILLYLDSTSAILTGKALVGGVLQDVFTVTINQGTSDYTVDLIRTIDNGSGATFNNLSGGVAGNPPFKLVSSANTGAEVELLFTPREAGAADANGSINSDTDDLGVNGQFIDLGFGVSIDFGNFTYFANGGGTDDDRYDHVAEGDINGFRFTIDQISNGSTVDVALKAFEYTGDPVPVVQQKAPSEAAYTQEQITTVKVYDVAGVLLHTIQFDWAVPGVKITAVDPDGVLISTSTGVALTIGGITYGTQANGTVIVSNLLSDYKIETFTADGYDRITIDNVGTPSTTDGKFSISELQIEQTNAGNPVNLLLDLQIMDGDGDTAVILDAIDITVLPASDAPAPPVVLDLDGDGVEFVSQAAGVTFDYLGDGTRESTAWVGADDGLLALDRNGDGIVNDGSEIVFARDGLTDLQGLAADFDSNRDGVLDANDVDFAKFGVWQDANSNGVTDAGEYRSLSDAGIVSIGLVSDGIAYSAANGSVSVAGQSVYTKADGSTGIVADAAFATNGTTSVASRSADQIRTSNVTTSVIAAALVGIAVEENAAAAPNGNLGKLGEVASEASANGNGVVSSASTSEASVVSTLAFQPTQEFGQRTNDVGSSLRPSEEAGVARGLQDAPMAERSAVIEDKADPVSDDQSNFAGAFGGGDQVMHSMLDITAFSASAGAGESAALPIPIADTLREAMPDLILDRLIDAFTAALGAPANDAGGGANDSALLVGILNQGVDAFQLAAMASNDLSSAHHYDMAMISNG